MCSNSVLQNLIFLCEEVKRRITVYIYTWEKLKLPVSGMSFMSWYLVLKC